MTSMLGVAIAITAEAFRDKFDKGGRPYIEHCLWVMNNTEGDDDVKCAAIMHDLIEDTDWTYGELHKLGFTLHTTDTLLYVTHDPRDTYDDYIKNITNDKYATRIKLADLRHNSCITRLKGLRKKDFERMEKYHRSYKYLRDVADVKGWIIP